jgi:hypothetical protein
LGAHDSEDITELLEAWGEGDQVAFERLVPLVYAGAAANCPAAHV